MTGPAPTCSIRSATVPPALFYQKDMIQDDYKAMAEYILNFTEKYHMTFPGWEPERMAKLDELFKAYAPRHQGEAVGEPEIFPGSHHAHLPRVRREDGHPHG